jgi:uncharacterized membrane protein
MHPDQNIQKSGLIRSISFVIKCHKVSVCVHACLFYSGFFHKTFTVLVSKQPRDTEETDVMV